MKRLDERYEPVTIANQDDVGSNRSSSRPLLEIHEARLQRRAVLRGFVTTAAAGALGGGTFTSKVALAAAEGSPSSLGFQSIPQTIAETHAVAPGYAADVLIRWGDPVLAGAPTWDPMNQTAEAQAKHFGYNCDFLAYFPLPAAPTAPSTGCSIRTMSTLTRS